MNKQITTIRHKGLVADTSLKIKDAARWRAFAVAVYANV